MSNSWNFIVNHEYIIFDVIGLTFRLCCIYLIDRMGQLFTNVSGECGNLLCSPFNSSKNVLNTIEAIC